MTADWVAFFMVDRRYLKRRKLASRVQNLTTSQPAAFRAECRNPNQEQCARAQLMNRHAYLDTVGLIEVPLSPTNAP
jgi:hypothetical protein